MSTKIKETFRVTYIGGGSQDYETFEDANQAIRAEHPDADYADWHDMQPALNGDTASDMPFGDATKQLGHVFHIHLTGNVFDINKARTLAWFDIVEKALTGVWDFQEATGKIIGFETPHEDRLETIDDDFLRDLTARMHASADRAEGLIRMREMIEKENTQDGLNHPTGGITNATQQVPPQPEKGQEMTTKTYGKFDPTTLLEFCEKHPRQYPLGAPFVADGYMYATDGVIAARVLVPADTTNTVLPGFKFPDIAKVFQIEKTELRNLPPATTEIDFRCVWEDDDEVEISTSSVQIESATVDIRYWRTIVSLPNPRLACEIRKDSPILILFDADEIADGEVVLMPMERHEAPPS